MFYANNYLFQYKPTKTNAKNTVYYSLMLLFENMLCAVRFECDFFGKIYGIIMC